MTNCVKNIKTNYKPGSYLNEYNLLLKARINEKIKEQKLYLLGKVVSDWKEVIVVTKPAYCSDFLLM